MTPVEAAYAALGHRDWAAYRDAMSRPCPWCRAEAHRPCTTMGLRLTHGDRIHPARR